MAQWHDREVLKGEPEYEREREVRKVLRPQRGARDRCADREQHPLAEHVPERTPGAAVSVADPHRHRKRIVTSDAALLPVARAVEAPPPPVGEPPERAGVERG